MNRNAWLYYASLYGVVIAGVLAAGTTAWLRHRPASADLPVIRPAPAFELTEQSGQPFDAVELAGRVWVADFIFTNCAGPCPLMTQRMRELQQRLAALPDVRFVSFSVDPQRDTPAVLRAYADRFDAGPGWYFLTGPRDAIYRMCLEGFLLTVEDQRPADRPVPAAIDAPASRPSFDDLILHSTKFVLVDHRGGIRGYYESTDPANFEALLRAVHALARDVRVPPRFAALPAVNATLNVAATFLLLAAYLAIRRRHVPLHATLMCAATTTSALFLTTYVAYHLRAGSTRFAGTGAPRAVYLLILSTHVVLAAAIVPLVLVTLYRAATRSFERHRRIARITYPVWLYVSVTGVIVYWMLYHAFPPPGLTL